MKKLLLVGAGLLSLCTVGLTTAKAGPYDYYRRDRGDDYGYRRPVHHERCDDEGYGYRSHRRVVVVREYERPSYDQDECRPRYHRRRHVGFFLPLPPFPF